MDGGGRRRTFSSSRGPARRTRGRSRSPSRNRAVSSVSRLVVIAHGSNVSGAVQDGAAVGRICRERGGCVTCRCWAALVILPSLAIARK